MLIHVVVTVIASVAYVDAKFHRCPDLEPMKSFQPDRFLGGWNIIEWQPSTKQERELRCVEMNFNGIGEGYIKTNRKGILPDGTEITNYGSGYIKDTKKPAQFAIEWDGVKGKTQRTFTILDTDYKTYALLATCAKDKGDLEVSFMARETDLSESKLKKLRRTFRKRTDYDLETVQVSHEQCEPEKLKAVPLGSTEDL